MIVKLALRKKGRKSVTTVLSTTISPSLHCSLEQFVEAVVATAELPVVLPAVSQLGAEPSAVQLAGPVVVALAEQPVEPPAASRLGGRLQCLLQRPDVSWSRGIPDARLRSGPCRQVARANCYVVFRGIGDSRGYWFVLFVDENKRNSLGELSISSLTTSAVGFGLSLRDYGSVCATTEPG